MADLVASGGEGAIASVDMRRTGWTSWEGLYNKWRLFCDKRNGRDTSVKDLLHEATDLTKRLKEMKKGYRLPKDVSRIADDVQLTFKKLVEDGEAWQNKQRAGQWADRDIFIQRLERRKVQLMGDMEILNDCFDDWKKRRDEKEDSEGRLAEKKKAMELKILTLQKEAKIEAKKKEEENRIDLDRKKEENRIDLERKKEEARIESDKVEKEMEKLRMQIELAKLTEKRSG